MTPKSVVLPVPLRPTRPTRAPVGMRAEAHFQQEAAGNADSKIVDDEHAAPFGRRRGAKQPLDSQASTDLVQPALAGFALIDDQIEARRALIADDGA